MFMDLGFRGLGLRDEKPSANKWNMTWSRDCIVG